MLVHRLFRSIWIPSAHGIRDLDVALESELFRRLISFDLGPAFHQPVDYGRMDRIKDWIVRDAKENAVKLDIGFHESSAIANCLPICFERLSQLGQMNLLDYQGRMSCHGCFDESARVKEIL